CRSATRPCSSGSSRSWKVDRRPPRTRSPIAPQSFDDRVLAGRPGRRLEHSDDLAGVLGGDRQLGVAAEVLGDVAVILIPVGTDGRDPTLDDLSRIARSAQDSLMLGRLGRAVDVAGAEGDFLGVDPVLHESSLGADDPPAGPVEPADAAGLDL